MDEGHSGDRDSDGRAEVAGGALRRTRRGRLPSGVPLVEQSDQALEGFGARVLLAAAVVGRRWIFAGAHESVARAVIDDGLILFAGGLHGGSGGGNGGGDARVVAGVEAVDRRGDVLERVVGGRRAVEDEGGGEIAAVGGEVEGLATAPAEARDEETAVGRGQFLAVVGGGVEVGGDDGGIERGDGLGDGVLAGEGIGSAAVGAEAGEQVGRDDDEALRGELVGHLLGPVAEAEDLVDHEDDGGLLADLGIDDEGLHGAVAVADGDVLAVARRFLQRRFGPVLREQRGGGEGEENDEGEMEQNGAAHGVSLALSSALRQGPRQAGGAYQIEDQPEQAGCSHPCLGEQTSLVGDKVLHHKIKARSDEPVGAGARDGNGEGDERRERQDVVVGPGIWGRAQGNQQKQREMLLPGPSATVPDPVAREPCGPNRRGQKLKPCVLQSKDGAQHPAHAAGCVQGGVDCAMKIIQDIMVEGDNGQRGTGIEEDGADGERPSLVLDGPEQKREKHQIEQVRLRPSVSRQAPASR